MQRIYKEPDYYSTGHEAHILVEIEHGVLALFRSCGVDVGPLVEKFSVQLDLGQLASAFLIQIAGKVKVSGKHDIEVALVTQMCGYIDHLIFNHGLDHRSVIIARHSISQGMEVGTNQGVVGESVLENLEELQESCGNKLTGGQVIL